MQMVILMSIGIVKVLLRDLIRVYESYLGIIFIIIKIRRFKDFDSMHFIRFNPLGNLRNLPI